ncbi:hypothetical protein GW17_00038072 [Ensete ventricosum]|nr:hypothetical protein GW17_00038072 [Ensete ventricosum]
MRSRGTFRERIQRPMYSSLLPWVSLRCGTGYLLPEREVSRHRNPNQSRRGVAYGIKGGNCLHLGAVEKIDTGFEGRVEKTEGLRQRVLFPKRHGSYMNRTTWNQKRGSK